MKAIVFAVAVAVAILPVSAERPNVDEVPLFARWLVSHGSWGTLCTLTAEGSPFGNVASYSDAGTGVPYFYLSTSLDPTGPNALHDPRVSFTLSEAQLGSCTTDPQSPACAKITVSGNLTKLDPTSAEAEVAGAALFDRHPQFAGFPKQNGTFAVFKLVIGELFLVNKAAPRRDLPVGDYLSAPEGN